MRQPPQRGTTRRWSRQPPLLLAVPFALFALAAICVGTPFTPTRVIGAAMLVALCMSGLVCGIRRTTSESAGRCSAPGEEAVSRQAQSISIQRADLADSVVLSSPRHDGQFKVALTFGTIALAALIVVICLVAGQMQRSGRITPFGLLLGSVMVLLPAALSLHITRLRVHVQITRDAVRVTVCRGLLGNTHLHWARGELRAIELAVSEDGNPVALVVRSDAQSSTIPIAGLTIAQMNSMRFTCTNQVQSASL